MLNTSSRAMELVTAPSEEPVSSADAKKHLELSGTDHDTHVAWLIEAARQQWEHDTDSAVIEQTWRLTTDSLQEQRFSKRPVSEITSVQYYDSSNAQQTLSSSVYQLDTAENAIRLAVDQSWPFTYSRWDAVTYTVKAGKYTTESEVPAIVRQAILLLVGHYFEDRGEPMSEAMRNVKGYEALVARFMRCSYP